MFGLFKKNKIENDPVITEAMETIKMVEDMTTDLRELNAQMEKDHEENVKFIAEVEARMRARGIQF